MTKTGCRRCSDCPNSDHHWLPNPDFGDGNDPRNPASVDFTHICKHCPAMGGECEVCDGEGTAIGRVGSREGDWGDEGNEVDEMDCPKCEGNGVIEGLKCTAWRE